MYVGGVHVLQKSFPEWMNLKMQALHFTIGKKKAVRPVGGLCSSKVKKTTF